MDEEQDVLGAAEARAQALAQGNADRLLELLHEEFRWTSHSGEVYDRAEFVRRNTQGDTVWRSQVLADPHVVVVEGTAVVSALVTDVVLGRDGEPETFRMPMTQVWVKAGPGWTCLAGHAGPRLP